MSVIHKFELLPNQSTAISTPEGSKALTVAFQGEGLYLWVLIPSTGTGSLGERVFKVFATGEDHDDFYQELKYIGTAFKDDGLVFHVMEEL